MPPFDGSPYTPTETLQRDRGLLDLMMQRFRREVTEAPPPQPTQVIVCWPDDSHIIEWGPPTSSQAREYQEAIAQRREIQRMHEMRHRMIREQVDSIMSRSSGFLGDDSRRDPGDVSKINWENMAKLADYIESGNRVVDMAIIQGESACCAAGWAANMIGAPRGDACVRAGVFLGLTGEQTVIMFCPIGYRGKQPAAEQKRKLLEVLRQKRPFNSDWLIAA